MILPMIDTTLFKCDRVCKADHEIIQDLIRIKAKIEINGIQQGNFYKVSFKQIHITVCFCFLQCLDIDVFHTNACKTSDISIKFIFIKR